MANKVIVSPSLTTEGGDSGNLFLFKSGAASASTVIGGSGSDTVDLLSGESAAALLDIDLKGGTDSIAVSGLAMSGSILRGGAGADTFAFSGALTEINTVMGGDGNDVINVAAAIDAQAFKLGNGSDIVSGAGNISASGSTVALGAGNDTLNITAGTFASADVIGGGGADSISVTFGAAATAVTVKGDAAGNVGKDTIRLLGAQVLDELNAQAAGGADVIEIGGGAGTLQGTGKVLGNYGGDQITLSSTVFLNADGFTVGGGAGSDTVTLNNGVEFLSAGSGALLIGGGGADSIALVTNSATTRSAGAAGFSAGAGYGTVIGGAGADSITFSGTFTNPSAGMAGVIAFSSYSDSTESNMDLINFTAGASAGGFILNLAMSDAVASGTTNGTDQQITAGVLVSAGNNTTFSQVLSAADALNTVTGRSVVFTHSGDAYVFVQGGSTDLVARFQSDYTYSAGDITFAANASGEFRLKMADDT